MKAHHYENFLLLIFGIFFLHANEFWHLYRSFALGKVQRGNRTFAIRCCHNAYNLNMNEEFIFS